MAETIQKDTEDLPGMESTNELQNSVEPTNFDPIECFICVTQSTECLEIHNAKTNTTGTPLHIFLFKFTNINRLYCQAFAKHICYTCYNLINELEKAELEYLKLKESFELIISNNPLIHSPQKPNIPYKSVDEFKPKVTVEAEFETIKQESSYDGGNSSTFNTVIKLEPMSEDDLEEGDPDSDYNPEVSEAKTARRRSKAAGLKNGAEDKTPATTFQAEDEETNKQTGDMKTYDCVICHQKFTLKGNYKRHLSTHTGVLPFQCTVCERNFKRKDHLLNHIRTHTGEKPYECSVCLIKFTQKGSIIAHLRTHTGIQPFECTYCHKRFKQRTHLNSHLRIHTGERPYECDICQRRFTLSSKLKIHSRTHTGETPYKCTYCDSQFKQIGNLQSHMRIHTGEKPYECEVCRRTFSLKHHLRDHFSTHTGEKPYHCFVCNLKFNYKHVMQRHVKVMHPSSQSQLADVNAETEMEIGMGVVNAEPEIEIRVDEDEEVSFEPPPEVEVRIKEEPCD